MGKLKKMPKKLSPKALKVKGNVNTFKAKNKKKTQKKAKKKLNDGALAHMPFDNFLSKRLDETNSEESDPEKEINSDEEDSVHEDGEYSDLEIECSDENTCGDIDKGDSAIENTDGEEEDEASSSDENDAQAHKKSLAKLKETDPEFYEFLQDNDKKLLDFNLSDETDDEKDEDDELHKPTTELEVASDESDFEEDDTETDNRVITLKMLKTWQNNIQTDKSNSTITALIRAFHAALLRVTNEEDEEAAFYKVEGSSVFNGIIQICVLELGPAIRRYLKIAPGSKQPPHKCKRFVKIKALLRGYFADLLKILNGVTSSNILTVLLKHLHYVSPMIVSYRNIIKPILKKLTELWSGSKEEVRVVAFLCILRITTNQQQSLLDPVLKMMHLAYVKNSRFVSTNSLPGINFMRRSLVEMFALDLNLAYQHVFLYIRQLAIHLRNAITIKKKENIQAVYNWQFINCLRLWGNLLSVTHNKPQLKPLVYPFVQVSVGTIKLIPTSQYYPLRFHVVQILMDLSDSTSVFIPILPFLLEVLTSYDFNKKHQKVSMKPLQFTSLLRLSKSQLSENGFKDTVIDTIYAQLLEYLSSNSHSIAFPDLTFFCTVQLKEFLKKCTVSNYCRRMRQILEKIDQNAKFIQQERKNVEFNISDFKQIDAWQTTIKNNGTPIKTFFESWNKMRNIKKSKEATKNDIIGDYNLPLIKRKKNPDEKPAEKRNENGMVELFPSDSESEAEETTTTKRKRGTRGGKNANKKHKKVTVENDVDDNMEEDIVEDIKESDW